MPSFAKGKPVFTKEREGAENLSIVKGNAFPASFFPPWAGDGGRKGPPPLLKLERRPWPRRGTGRVAPPLRASRDPSLSAGWPRTLLLFISCPADRPIKKLTSLESPLPPGAGPGVRATGLPPIGVSSLGVTEEGHGQLRLLVVGRAGARTSFFVSGLHRPQSSFTP